MKKLTALLLCVCAVFSLAACGSQSNVSSVASLQQSVPPSTAEQSAETSAAPEVPAGGGNILIAYFTLADNTQVDNPDAVDMDATASASVLPPGNAALMAGWIQQRTGGDLFSITVTEPYPSDYDECLERAADEKAENARPALASHVEHIEAYDTVFLGFPNWWYTVPMAIHSFLDEYDFSGKTVIPFVTHGTGGLSSTIQDMTAALPDTATVLQPIGVYREEVRGAQDQVNAWLDGMGFTNTPEAPSVANEENTMRTVTMTVNSQTMTIALHDTPAANALYDMLPLELTFDDFNNTEKISYPPEELPTTDGPDQYDTAIGDLCLYAPWGNLAIFYQDYQASTDLIPMGRVESGIEVIAAMDEPFTATLEAGA